MDASSNVLVEDLLNTRSLETTYYVTDATQAYDSFWDRESGLRVHIGVSSVHLIPEYDDVEHQSDNNYMLTDPNSSEDKSVYRAVMLGFCRSLDHRSSPLARLWIQVRFFHGKLISR